MYWIIADTDFLYLIDLLISEFELVVNIQFILME
jgi:hypothetical protein